MSKVREEFPGERKPKSSTAAVIQNLPNTLDTPILLRRVREYLLAPGAPNVRLSPGWLAKKLNIDERELLGALAYGVRDGLLEMHMYAERGDPHAYRLVRDHFAILGEAIDRSKGALVKTIGDGRK